MDNFAIGLSIGVAIGFASASILGFVLLCLLRDKDA